MPHPSELDTLMSQGQLAYGEGRLDYAGVHYQQAYGLATEFAQPDWLTAARAARGVLEVNHRQGVGPMALEYWRDNTAAALENATTDVAEAHGWTLAEMLKQDVVPETARPAVREIIQTGTVLGKITMREALAREAGSRLGRHMVGQGAEREILHNIRRSGRLLPLVEADGPIDQYRINWHGPAAFAERLYGSRRRAAIIAAEAVRHASKSESPVLPTAANLSEENRRAAVKRARARAWAAVASIALPRVEAVHLAKRVI